MKGSRRRSRDGVENRADSADEAAARLNAQPPRLHSARAAPEAAAGAGTMDPVGPWHYAVSHSRRPEWTVPGRVNGAFGKRAGRVGDCGCPGWHRDPALKHARACPSPGHRVYQASRFCNLVVVDHGSQNRIPYGYLDRSRRRGGGLDNTEIAGRPGPAGPAALTGTASTAVPSIPYNG